MSTKAPSKTLAPSAEAQQSGAKAPTGSAGKVGLIGLPKGTKIKIGQETSVTPKDRPFSPEPVASVYGEVTFVEGDAEKIFANKSAQDKAQLLLRLGQIPNLYASGEAPTPEYVSRALASGTIVPRTEDINAFKKILIGLGITQNIRETGKYTVSIK